MSAASVCSLQLYENRVAKAADCVDDMMKEQQVLVTLTNDLHNQMQPLLKLNSKINTIKSLLNALETLI